MKAIKIDSKTLQIREVDYSGDYKEIYKLLEIPGPFTVIDLGNGETLYIDDEGLLNESNHDFFILNGKDWKYPQPLAGNGLILGVNEEGETIATKLRVSQVAANVQFTKLTIKGWTAPQEGEVDHPVFGKTFMIDAGQPIFGPYVEGEDDQD